MLNKQITLKEAGITKDSMVYVAIEKLSYPLDQGSVMSRSYSNSNKTSPEDKPKTVVLYATSA